MVALDEGAAAPSGCRSGPSCRALSRAPAAARGPDAPPARAALRNATLAARGLPCDRYGAMVGTSSAPPLSPAPSAKQTRIVSEALSASLRHLVAVGWPSAGAMAAPARHSAPPPTGRVAIEKRAPGVAAATTRCPQTTATAALGKLPRPPATSARALAIAPPSMSSVHSPRKAAKRRRSFSGRARAAVLLAAPPAASDPTTASAPAGRSRWARSIFRAFAALWKSDMMMCFGAGFLADSGMEPALGTAAAPPVKATGRDSPSLRGRCTLPTSSNQKRSPVASSKKMFFSLL
mmetsp:Transcript_19797/g.55669  ORF Transcript_19797/g.55669 Transcript_19797/m.55669 type:complete len:292 (+) Transcript_19797:481-1356(+)